MDVFAESYAEMTGSGLAGQEALAKFYEDIEKGNIESAKILPIVARILSERAAPKIDIMKKSSIAEQARSQNMQTQMLESFSKAGGETGFARLWRTATDAMREMDRVMPNIGQIFDKGTYFFRQLILLPQSIGRMFDGRDSNFQKWLLGQGETGETIMQMMFNMRDILKEIGELGGKSYEGWKMLFDLFKDSGALGVFLNKLKTYQESLLETLKAINKLADGDLSGAREILESLSTFVSPLIPGGGGGGVGRELAKRLLHPTSETQDPLLDYHTRRFTAINTPGSGYYGWTPEMYDENARNMAEDRAREMSREMELASPQNNDDLVRVMMQSRQRATEAQSVNKTDVSIKVEANIIAQDAKGFANNLKLEIDKALGNYNFSQ